MDTKDTAETTAPSVTPAKPAPAAKPAGEPEPEEPVPSVPLSGLGDDSLEGLRAAFSALSVGGPDGKEKEKEKQAVDTRAEEVYPADAHGSSDEVPFEDEPVESAPSASDYPAVPLVRVRLQTFEERTERLRLPCTTLSNNHYTPSSTSSYILAQNHSTYG